MKIVITPNGELTFIYDDSVANLLSEGQARVTRASHVEPQTIDGKIVWTADMSPSSGPILGPFTTRSAALTAEREWLELNSMGKIKVTKHG